LRVISGSARGVKLIAPSEKETRPTLDYVKETLFNILIHNIRNICGSNILDLYSGTGSLGIEALSRGAKHCVFIDSSMSCKNIIEQNLKHTKLYEKARIITTSVVSGIQKLKMENLKFDIIFADPPYKSISVHGILNEIMHGKIFSTNTIVVIEHEVSEIITDSTGHFYLEKFRDYRSTRLSFYKCYTNT